MDFLGKKKKILYAGCVFFAVMFLCTLLSRGIYGASLPQVETEKPEKRAIGHTVEAEGMVTANREVSVDAISGLKVNRIYVNLGDSVSANTLLFDVDQDDLKEKISEQELAIKKLEMSSEQARQQKELEAGKELLAQNRSLEDYALADTEENRKIEQAGDAVKKAEEKLNEHLNNQPRQTPEEERNQKKQEYKDWDSWLKELQKQQISAASELEEAMAKESAAQKALDDYIAAHGDSGGNDPGGSAGGDNGGSGGGSGSGSGDDAGGGSGDDTVGDSGGDSGGESGSGSDSGGGSDENQAGDGDVSGNDAGAGNGGTDGSTADSGDTGSAPENNNADDAAPSGDGSADNGAGNGDGGTDTGTDPEREKLEEALRSAAADRENAERRVKSIEEEFARGNIDSRSLPDYTSEESAWENWESTKKSLEDSVESAKQSQENSVWDKLDAMLEAKRKVEDSTLGANPDMTIEMNQMEISYRNEILQKYILLQKADGQIFSQDNGIVTKIKISSGERIPDGASVVLADLDESFQFRVTLTKEQKKYVNINDMVSLKLGNNGTNMEGRITYLAESESTPGSFDAIIYLPPGEGAVGQSGIMTVSAQSRSYPLTIPAKAVYSENGMSYIYIIRKQQGILGEELAASRINVNVLDKNNKFASIEEGTIDADTEIIVNTTKALQEGTIVRYGSSSGT